MKRLMPNQNYLLGALLFIVLAPISFAQEKALFPGSGISASAEQIPSAFWPQFVTTTQAITSGEKKIKEGTRGVFLRAEDNQLVIDFGRHGVEKVNPKSTNFYDEVTGYMSGDKEKEFPNFSLQVGNKMMTFGRGKKSGPIRFEEAIKIELYVLLYLDSYASELARPLVHFGEAYKDLKAEWPTVEVVLMPRDRKFYDFGATVGYSVPYITPHVRVGYIKSLSHAVGALPGFVAVDANGRILNRSETPVEWENLSESLENLVNDLGIPWSQPKIRRKAYQRTTWWNN